MKANGNGVTTEPNLKKIFSYEYYIVISKPKSIYNDCIFNFEMVGYLIKKTLFIQNNKTKVEVAL